MDYGFVYRLTVPDLTKSGTVNFYILLLEEKRIIN